jgi:hypothetical protein
MNSAAQDPTKTARAIATAFTTRKRVDSRLRSYHREGIPVFTLRCTSKLRKRLGSTEDLAPVPPSTRLGDWYAHLLFTRPQLVLCVSERTLLPVLIPARDGRLLVPRLRAGVGHMLGALGVAEAAVAAEKDAMGKATIGKTLSRRVLGSMNDFVRMLDSYRGIGTLLDVSLRLAETPCGPLHMNTPREETIRLFTLPT